MNIERGFISANCSAPNRPALPGRPSTWSVTTSDSLEQLVEAADPAGVAVGEPVGGVEEDHPQAEGLGEVAELGADVAVADDAEGPAAHLVAALRRLVPDPGVHLLGLLGQPAGQRDDLADHQLHDAARVGVRRVEGGDARARPPPRGRAGWCRCRTRPTASRSGALPSTFSVTLVFERTPSSALPCTASIRSSSESECDRVCRRRTRWRSKTSIAASGGCSRGAGPRVGGLSQAPLQGRDGREARCARSDGRTSYEVVAIATGTYDVPPGSEVVGVDDAVGVALLGEEPLPVLRRSPGRPCRG